MKLAEKVLNLVNKLSENKRYEVWVKQLGYPEESTLETDSKEEADKKLAELKSYEVTTRAWIKDTQKVEAVQDASYPDRSIDHRGFNIEAYYSEDRGTYEVSTWFKDEFIHRPESIKPENISSVIAKLKSEIEAELSKSGARDADDWAKKHNK